MTTDPFSTSSPLLATMGAAMVAGLTRSRIGQPYRTSPLRPSRNVLSNSPLLVDIQPVASPLVIQMQGWIRSKALRIMPGFHVNRSHWSASQTV